MRLTKAIDGVLRTDTPENDEPSPRLHVELVPPAGQMVTDGTKTSDDRSLNMARENELSNL